MNYSLSIIVPNYNHEAYLKMRLSSISNQSLQNFHCFLLDDASKDESITILSNLTSSDSRFRLTKNFKNSGSTFCQWNKGVSLSTDDFVWIAESDDFADRTFIDRVSKPLLSDPDIVLSFCQSYRVDQLGNINGTWLDDIDEIERSAFTSDFIMDGKEFISKYLIHMNVIPNASAVIFRKKIYDMVGGAPEDLKTNGDWLTWLKMLCVGKVAFISQPLNYFRFHDASIIGKLKFANNSINYIEQYDRSLRKQFRKYLNENKIYIDPGTKFINDQYISYDNGNEAIHLFKKKKMLKALPLLLFSTFLPKFKSGYLKKILFK